MVAAMNVYPRHTWRLTRLRILSLVLVAMLWATPALAAANFAADCERCPCCRTAADTGAAGAGHSGCCGHPDTTPCHMAAQELPEPPPARIQNSTKTPEPSAHQLLAAHQLSAVLPATLPSYGRVVATPIYPQPDIYLQICRLIC